MSKDDVSLDDELLQVTEKKSSNNARVAPKKSKDTKRDEEDDGEEVSNGDDSDYNKNGKRKTNKNEPKKPQPLKKRKTGESSESSEDEAFDDGWDDDLMGDEADRAKLNAMPMIEREEILAERYTKRKEMREAWTVKRRIRAEQRSKEKKDKKDGGGKKEAPKDNREIRDKTVKKADSKSKALSELKKKRAKAGYKNDSEDEGEDGEVDDSKDDDDYAPKKSVSSDQHSSNKSSKSKEEGDDRRAKDSNHKEITKRKDEPDYTITLQEVEKLRLGREALEKWVNKPFFNTLVPGFFVRIGIGMDPSSRMNVYRLAQIDSVQNKTPYLFNGKQTNKYLRLLIGDKTKEFRMETISNRPVSESEYKHWKMQMENSTRAAPTSDEVPEKLKTLALANDYKYTSEDIERMLAEKKESGSLPIKLSAEKARLAILRDTETNDHERAKLEKKIAELDELVKEREKKRSGNGSVLNINQRNKNYNFVTTLESKVEEKSGTSDTDPFSRRRTLPRITYASKHRDEDIPGETTPPPTSPIPTNGTTNGTAEPSSSSAESNGATTSMPSPSSTNGNALKLSAGLVLPKASEHDSIDIDIPLGTSSATTTTLPSSRPFTSLHNNSNNNNNSSSSSVQPDKKTKSLSLDDYMRRRRAME